MNLKQRSQRRTEMQQEEQFLMETKSLFVGKEKQKTEKGKERHVNIENTEKEFCCMQEKD